MSGSSSKTSSSKPSSQTAKDTPRSPAKPRPRPRVVIKSAPRKRDSSPESTPRPAAQNRGLPLRSKTPELPANGDSKQIGSETYPLNPGPGIAPGNNTTQIGGPPLALGGSGLGLGSLTPSACATRPRGHRVLIQTTLVGALVRLVRRAIIGQLTATRASVLILIPILKGRQIHRSWCVLAFIEEHALCVRSEL